MSAENSFRDWQDAANLQYTVYMPFVNWMRQRGFSDREITRLTDIEEYELRYWRECIRIDPETALARADTALEQEKARRLAKEEFGQ